MLYGILVTLYILISIFLVVIVMIQRGKSGIGLGGVERGTQMIFGGGGGQDLLQKITWGLGAIFIAASFSLALLKSRESKLIAPAKPLQSLQGTISKQAGASSQNRT